MTKLEILSNQMEELARYAVPSANYNKELANKYYEVRNLWLEEKQRVDTELGIMLTEKHVAEARKTFVNSFGEATKREITSKSYKTSQKRIERDVLRNLGR